MVLILERGGRFFGDGVYIGFGGKLVPYNPQKDNLPTFNSNLILIVDSVINTGNSTLAPIDKLKINSSNVQICIVANAIQVDAIPKLREYAVFAVRLSANKFVGKRQRKQTGNTGPDTADRLFNLIDE